MAWRELSNVYTTGFRPLPHREREERTREREQMQATIDDLRARLDRAESRITGLLPAPSAARRRWRLWGRG